MFRLHFFDETVAFDSDALKLRGNDQCLSDHYFGFIGAPPYRYRDNWGGALSLQTFGTVPVGTSSPPITRVHLLGYRLTVQGFPSMDQHIDINVCAHVACWSILRHYSERYSTYREFLTHDITLMAQEFNPGGLVAIEGVASLPR